MKISQSLGFSTILWRLAGPKINEHCETGMAARLGRQKGNLIRLSRSRFFLEDCGASRQLIVKQSDPASTKPDDIGTSHSIELQYISASAGEDIGFS